MWLCKERKVLPDTARHCDICYKTAPTPSHFPSGRTPPANEECDLQVSQKLAVWFGPPYNSWNVGNIAEINKRTKMENVSVEFKDDTYGVTRGTFN